MNPLLKCDTYKTCHESMMPKGMERLDSYFVPRKSMIEKQQKIVFFGLQAFLQKVKKDFDENFFKVPVDDLKKEYMKYMNIQLGQDVYNTDRIEKLHKLGYLPLEIEALPEGSLVNMGVPMIHIHNTLPEFHWLGQWFECWVLNEVWKSCNFATIGHMYYKLAKKYYDMTTDGLDPRNAAADFSMRGMSGMDEAEKCSAAWLLSFNKTSTIPALNYIDKYYDADCSLNGFGKSCISTEHSVMAANYAIDGDEISFYRRMLTELYPDSTFSIVSDTYDYWNIVDNILPQLKNEILNHNGKLLVRPDSGDQYTNVIETVQKLWDTFGGTVNSKGYKVLNPHIGIILGDGATLQCVEKIWKKLTEMKFAASNVAFGCGAFAMTAVFEKDKMIINTRDTWNMACKATYCVINGKEYPIFKDPKTDSGMKKSHRGLVHVSQDENGDFKYVDNLNMKEYEDYNKSHPSAFITVFKDGEFYNRQSFPQIRKRLD